MRWGMGREARILLHKGRQEGKSRREAERNGGAPPPVLPPSPPDVAAFLGWLYTFKCLESFLPTGSLHPDSCHCALSWSWQASVQINSLARHWLIASSFGSSSYCAAYATSFLRWPCFFSPAGLQALGGQGLESLHLCFSHAHPPINCYKHRKWVEIHAGWKTLPIAVAVSKRPSGKRPLRCRGHL